MNKKGAEFAVGTVVMIVLGLAVLVILILVVRQQVTKGSQGYSDISDQATVNPTKCTSIIMDRRCVASGECTGRKVPPPQGGWTDCTQGTVCCQ